MTETRRGSQSVYYIILPQSPSSSPSPRRENLIAVDAHRPPSPDLCPSLTHSHLIDLLPVHHNNHFQRLPLAADLAREGAGCKAAVTQTTPPPFALSLSLSLSFSLSLSRSFPLSLPPVPILLPPMLTRKAWLWKRPRSTRLPIKPFLFFSSSSFFFFLIFFFLLPRSDFFLVVFLLPSETASPHETREPPFSAFGRRTRATIGQFRTTLITWSQPAKRYVDLWMREATNARRFAYQ